MGGNLQLGAIIEVGLWIRKDSVLCGHSSECFASGAVSVVVLKELTEWHTQKVCKLAAVC